MAIEPKTTGDIRADSIDSKSTPGAGTIDLKNNKFSNVTSGTARSHLPNIGQVQDSTVLWGGTSSGAANVYAITCSPAVSAYATGQIFRFLSHQANTSAPTLNVNGLGAKTIVDRLGTALTAGVLATGTIYEALYDGTSFRLIPCNPVITSVAEGSGVINTTTGALADYTGASVTVTTKAGDIVEVDAFINISNNPSPARIWMQVNQDGVDLSSALSSMWVSNRSDNNGQDDHISFHRIYQPSAGSHTYKIRWAGPATTYSNGYRLSVKVTPVG